VCNSNNEKNKIKILYIHSFIIQISNCKTNYFLKDMSLIKKIRNKTGKPKMAVNIKK